MLLSKATYNWGIHKVIHLEEKKQTEEVLITSSLRYCSSKYKLARKGEKDKEKEEYVFFFFRMKSSSVEREEFSIVA